jgi:hypothetical protein
VALHKKVCWVYNSPVLGTAGISVTVDPRFLQRNDIPVIGVSAIENIGVRCFGLMGILLPDSEL